LQDRRVSLNGGDGTREGAVELAPRVAVAIQVRRGSLVYLAEGQLDQAVDDRPLVGKVEVQRGAADERPPRNGVDGDALISLFRERRAGGVED
jgi:hypothetical protein